MPAMRNKMRRIVRRSKNSRLDQVSTRFDQASISIAFCSRWQFKFFAKTRSSWLNCALRDDEAVHWVSIGHYEVVAVGDWWIINDDRVSRGQLCLYISHKVEIWSGVTDALRTHWLTDRLRKIELLSSFKVKELSSRIAILLDTRLWQWIRKYS